VSLAGTATQTSVAYTITDGKVQTRDARQLVWGAAATATVAYRMSPLELRVEVPLLVGAEGRIDVVPVATAGVSF
jgi:hypothetical protein